MSTTLPKSAVTCLVSEGRFTLQVPQYSLFGGPNDYTTYNDDYFIPVKGGADKIAAGKEVSYAFTYLSRKGFQHYYNDLKAAFVASRGNWQEFEQYANDWLDKVEQRAKLDVAKMTALNAIEPKPYRIKKCQELVDVLNTRF